MAQKKTEYVKYLKIPTGKTVSTFEVNKTFLCDMANANACQKRAQWYGIDSIGPRNYMLYKCPQHGMIRRRL